LGGRRATCATTWRSGWQRGMSPTAPPRCLRADSDSKAALIYSPLRRCPPSVHPRGWLRPRALCARTLSHCH
jgi:hypothetical protein